MFECHSVGEVVTYVRHGKYGHETNPAIAIYRWASKDGCDKREKILILWTVSKTNPTAKCLHARNLNKVVNHIRNGRGSVA